MQDLNNVLQTRLFSLSGTPINLLTLLVAVAIIVIAFWVSRVIGHAVERLFRRRGIQDSGSLAVSKRLTHYIVLAIGFGISVHTLGIDLTALFAAGAVFALGLGFAMQNIAQNFVSGIILLIERAIKPGDVLEVDGDMVRVVRMGIRATVARTLNEEDIIIPNSTLVQSTVKNYTLRDTEYRVRTIVGVTYSSDLRAVEQALRGAAERVSAHHLGKPPRVLLQQFGSSSVDFEVSIWASNPWDMRTIRSELNSEIWWALKDAGITIAFPQLDVHFDEPIMQDFRRMGSHR